MTPVTSSPRPVDEASVLIAGAGPTGLACAAELAHQGVDCLVVEPRQTVSHLRPRAKTTSVRTMEHFRRWGVADALRAAAPIPLSWSDQVIFCTSLTGQVVTSFPGAFGLTSTRHDLYAESSQVVPQPVVETVLREHLADRPEVELEFGSSVVSIDEQDDLVVVTVCDQHGATREVRAGYVVGCDGPKSVVRRDIGATLVGRSDPRPNFNVVFRAPGLVTDLPAAVQYWVVGAQAPGLIGRLDLEGLWWAILPGIDPEHGQRNVANLIAGLVGRPVDHEVVAVDPWTARMLIADRFQSRRVFLAGEAAHLNPPWGGHGYNTSVGDAVNVGWKIAAVAQGWGGELLLPSYEPERRPVVTRTVEVAESNMGKLAVDLSVDADSIQEAKRAEFHSLGLVLGYSYGASPVVQGGAIDDQVLAASGTYLPSICAGARLPHMWLDDGRALYDVLGRGMTLIGPIAGHREETADLAEAACRLQVPLTVIDPPDGWPWPNEFVLIRPDQHVAWHGYQPGHLDLDIVLGLRHTEARSTGRR